jgi:MraZ protein
MGLPAALLGSVDVTLTDGLLRLPEAFAASFVGGLVVTVWLDGCVALWPRAAWERLTARLADLPVADGRARAFARLLFSSAVALEPGRRSVRLSDEHRRSAELDGRGVLVGAGDHVEVWSPARWAEQSDRRLDEFATVLAG